ncbi:RNA Pol II elongator-associated protein, partial [Phytophthora palmivora]
YVDSRAEKNTRSALKAAVEKVVNTKTIVVLDALNHTKGERYELFCKAKAESTTYCVIYVDTSVEVALNRNAEREEQLDPKLLEELAARFEVPVEKNRWDSPLFRLTPDDFAADGTRLPLDAIMDAIRFGKTVKAGLATKAAPAAESSFLQALDEVTNAIVEALLGHQRDAGVADGLRVPPHTVNKELRLTRPLSTAEARRHRRQYIKITRIRPCPVATIGDFFVEYLNQQA